MKCPRCGFEMLEDAHRKYPVLMCYECGYTEGRNVEQDAKPVVTNFEHMKTLDFNELTAFLSAGLDIPEEKIADWLDDWVE